MTTDLLEVAIEQELKRVSHVHYDSHEICKHFAGELVKAIAKLEAAKLEAQPKFEMPDEPELFKFINSVPILQSLLYDINLLPEQIQDSVRWGHMVAVCSHFEMALINKAAQPEPTNVLSFLAVVIRSGSTKEKALAMAIKDLLSEPVQPSESEDEYFAKRPQLDCNDRRMVFRAGQRAAQPVGIPAGMKLVPIEPTKAMQAAYGHHFDYHLYQDMLAAAPALPVEPVPTDPAWMAEKAALDALDDGHGPYMEWMFDSEEIKLQKQSVVSEFLAWTHANLGQGYSLACHEGSFIEPVTSYAFRGYLAWRFASPAAPTVELPVWIPVDRLPEKCAIYRVLVMLGNGNKCVSLGYWDGEGWQRVHEAGEYQDHEPYFDNYDMKVTDWKPLPDESAAIAGSKQS